MLLVLLSPQMTYGGPIMEEFEKNDEVCNTLLRWLYEQKENVEMLLKIYFIVKNHDHIAVFNDYLTKSLGSKQVRTTR